MKKKCFFTCLKYFQRCGARQPSSLAAPLNSVLRSMRSFLTLHRVEIRTIQMTREIGLRERSIPTLRQSHLDPIQLIWMRTRKRCFKSAVLVQQTLKVRRRRARCERRNQKKLVDSLSFRSSENSNKLASMYIDLSRSKASTITKKCLSWPWFPKAETRSVQKKLLKLMCSSQTQLLNRSKRS